MFGACTAAQLWAAAIAETPEIESELAATGRVPQLRDWHDEHVYRRGCSATTDALVEAATGAPTSTTALLAHLRKRYDLGDDE
jgi:carboxypeptidase Taq